MKAKRPFSKDPYHQIMSPKSSVTLPEGDSVQSWPILAGGADFVRSHVPRVRTSSCACTLFTSNAIHISPQSASRQSSRRYFLAQACSLHWWDRPINQLTLSVCVISVRPLIIAVRESSSLSPSLSRRHVPLLAPLSSLEGSYDYSYVTLECILIEYRWRAENVYNIHMCCRSKSRRRCNVYIYIYMHRPRGRPGVAICTGIYTCRTGTKWHAHTCSNRHGQTNTHVTDMSCICNSQRELLISHDRCTNALYAQQPQYIMSVMTDI